jgi:phosphate transport system substrate-binding protein
LFTNYLSKANAEWKSRVGESTSVKWPAGFGGKGNEGVAAYVQRLPGAIGYVEYAYVKQNKMTYALLRNQAGHFVAPEDSTFKAAAAGADWNRSFHQVLTDQPGKDAWPLTGATYILMHKTPEKPARAAAALKFFDWIYASGDAMAAELEYVALPQPVKALVRKQWATVKGADGKALMTAN